MDSTLGQVKWILDVDDSSYKRKIRGAGDDAKSLGRQLETTGAASFGSFAKSASSSLDSVANSIGAVLKAAVAVGVTGSVGIGAMTKAAFDQVRQVENASFALRAYESDAGKVNDILGSLVAYARSDMGVLFQRQDLFKAAANLRGFGEAAENVTDRVKILSRGVALGMTNFDELSQIVGRSAQAGNLTAEAYDQLAYRGIILDRSLRGAKISSDELYGALSNALPEELLAGRADTIDGRLIRLQSSFRDLGSRILGVDKDTSTFIKGGAGDQLLLLMEDLTKALKTPEMQSAFTNLGTQIVSLAKTAIPAILSAFQWLAENFDKVILAIKILTPLFIGLKVAAIGLNVIGTLANTVATTQKAITGLGKAMSATKTGFSLFKQGFQDTRVASSVFSGAMGTLGGIAKIAMTTVVTAVTVGAKAIGAAIISIPVVGWIIGIVAALIGLFTYFYTTSEEFRNFVNGIFSGIGEGIIAAFNGVGSFFADLWSGMKNGVKSVGKFFSDTWTNVSNVVNSVFKTIADIYAATLKPVIDGIVFIVVALGTIIGNIFYTIGNVIFTVVSTIVQILGVVLYGSIMWLWNSVLVPFGSFVVTLWNGMLAGISSAINAIAGVTTMVWAVIVNFMTDAINNIVNTVKVGFNFVRDIIVGAWNGVYAFIKPALDVFFNIFSTVINRIVGVVRSGFQLFRQYVIDPVAGAVNFVAGKVGELAGIVGGAVKKAVDAAVNFGRGFLSAGKDMIDGLVRGVQNGSGAVINKVKEICSGALDAVKKFFGIKSPSRVMAQMGGFLMEGFGNGVADAGKEAIDAVKDVNAEIMKQFSTGTPYDDITKGRMNVSANATQFVSSMGTEDASTERRAGATVNQTNNFYQSDDPNMEKVNQDLKWQLNKL